MLRVLRLCFWDGAVWLVPFLMLPRVRPRPISGLFREDESEGDRGHCRGGGVRAVFERKLVYAGSGEGCEKGSVGGIVKCVVALEDGVYQ